MGKCFFGGRSTLEDLFFWKIQNSAALLNLFTEHQSFFEGTLKLHGQSLKKNCIRDHKIMNRQSFVEIS